MSILKKDDRKDLVGVMRKTLIEHIRQDETLSESKRIGAENFILNEATYEQLLNLTYNEERSEKYYSAEVLEKKVLDSYAEFLQEQKVLNEDDKLSFEMIEEGVKSMANAAGKKVKGAYQTAAMHTRNSAGDTKTAAVKGFKSMKGRGEGRGVKATLKGVKQGAKEALGTTGGKVAAGTAGVGTIATGALAAKRKNKKEE